MPPSKRQKATLAERRTIVAANLKAGVNYRTIATGTGVSVGTICRDVKIILQEWREARVDQVDDWIELQVARLDELISAVWKEAMRGEVQAIDRVVKLMETQGRLLKFDEPAPQQHTITTLNADEFARLRSQAQAKAKAEQKQVVSAWQPSQRPTK